MATLDHDPIRASLLMHDAAEAKDGIDSRLTSFVDTLREIEELSLFDETMMFVAGQGMRVSRTDIGSWLLVEGLRESAEEAVDLLERYLSSEENPFRATIALGGIKLDKSIELGMGIELVPWEDLPDSHHKRNAEEHYPGLLPAAYSAAALIKTIDLPRLHLTDEERKQYKSMPYSFEELSDALLCMTLAGLQAPEIVVTWLEPPRWVPLRAVSMSIPGTSQHSMFPREYPEAAIGKLPGIIEAFLRLDTERKNMLRLPMKRLAQAIRQRSHIDAAIDLGIALESLFLRDLEPGEFSYRLRLRSARYLRDTIDDRDVVFKLVGELYTARSLAVHRGKIPPEKISKPIQELLEEGYALVAEAVQRLINEGDPDWKKVRLG